MSMDTLADPSNLGSGTQTKTYKNFIDGEWVESSTGETFENLNPADRRDVSVSSRNRAKPTWTPRLKPRRARFQNGAGPGPAARGDFLSRRRNAAGAQRRLRPRYDARDGQGPQGDARRRAGSHRYDAYYMAGEGRRMFGPTTPSELPDNSPWRCASRWVFADMITPWNFPMAIPSWKLHARLVAATPW